MLPKVDLTWRNAHGAPLPQIGDQVRGLCHNGQYRWGECVGYEAQLYSNHPKEQGSAYYICPIVSVDVEGDGSFSPYAFVPNEIFEVKECTKQS